MSGRFATLTFERQAPVPVAVLWQAWTAPAARANWAAFDERDGTTTVTLGMVFSSAAEFQAAEGFGAVELGQQTLGKLARFVGAE